MFRSIQQREILVIHSVANGMKAFGVILIAGIIQEPLATSHAEYLN